MSFREYFADAPYAAVGPELHPLLVDIGGIPPELLSRLSPETRAALAALKQAFSHKQADRHAASEPLRRLDATSDFHLGLIVYLLETSPQKTGDDILKDITRPRNRELVMTIAESLRNEGALKQSREVLVRLITKKFGLTDEERALIDNADDLDRLAGALDEILFAQTKEQVLAKLRS
jgi:hypothetical protein